MYIYIHMYPPRPPKEEIPNSPSCKIPPDPSAFFSPSPLSWDGSGKSVSAPSMLPPTPPPQEASSLRTPRHASTGALLFTSPDRRDGDADPGVESEDATGPGGDGGGGDAGKGGFKRGFKRMLQGVPSPSHFRRSMSFQGSVSAISNAANRVATGAMTPIRRRRHRREGSRDSSEGSVGVTAGEKPSRSGRSGGSSAHRPGRSGGGNANAAPENGRGSSTKADPVLLPGAKKHRRGKTAAAAGGAEIGGEDPDAGLCSVSSSDHTGGRNSGKISSSRSGRDKGSSSRSREKKSSGKSRGKPSRGEKSSSSSSSRKKDRVSSSAVESRQHRHSASNSSSAVSVETAQRDTTAVSGAKVSSEGADAALAAWPWGSPEVPQVRRHVGGDAPAGKHQQPRRGERAERSDGGGGTGGAARQEDVSSGRPPSHDGGIAFVASPVLRGTGVLFLVSCFWAGRTGRGLPTRRWRPAGDAPAVI